ncbi:MAG: CsgG/HfaB family protein [Phycisphaerae bacterium]|nr:CsgG/HfaB family protein [Phycisphaerae bacterium]
MNARTFHVVLVWSVLASLSSHAIAAPRVAIVASGKAAAGPAVAALVEVELSQTDKVEVLERSQVEKVLNEQNVSYSGLVRANAAVIAGRMLGVDAMAVIEAGDEGGVTGFRVFDIQSGARLVDEAVDGKQDAIAKQIAVGILVAARKQTAEANARMVTVMKFTNPSLPKKYDPLCRGAERLFAQALGRSENIMILERARLDLVNRERALAGPAGKQLAISAFLIDVEIRRAAEGDYQAHLRLTSPSGKQLNKGIAPFTELEAIRIVDAAAPVVFRWLDASVPKGDAVNRATEAKRFYEEKRFLQLAGNYDDALAAAEAAYAIYPMNRQLTLLIDLLQDRAGRLMKPATMDQSLAVLDRSIDLIELYVSRYSGRAAPPKWRKNKPKRSSFRPLWGYFKLEGRPDGTLHPFNLTGHTFTFESSRLGMILGQVEDYTPGHVELIRPIQDRYRRLLLEKLFPKMSANIRSVADQGQFNHWLARTFEYVPKVSHSAAQYVDTIDQLVGAWIESIARHGRANSWAEAIPRQLYTRTDQLSDTFGRKFRPGMTGQWRMDPASYRGLRSIFDRIAATPVPLVRLYAQAGQLICDIKAGDAVGRDLDSRFLVFRKAVHSAITAGGRQKNALQNPQYQCLLDVISALPDLAAMRRERQALFDFMLNRQELSFEVSRCAVLRNAPRALDNLARIERAMDDPRVRRLDSQKQLDDLVLSATRLHRPPTPQPTVAVRPDQMPWSKATVLLESGWESNGSKSTLSIPMFDGDEIFIVRIVRNKSYVKTKIELFQIDERKRTAIKHGECRWPAVPPPTAQQIHVTRAGTFDDALCCVTDGVLFVADATAPRILAWDIQAGTTRWIGTDEGLPGDEVKRIAGVAGKVFALTMNKPITGRYLVAYDPRTSRLDVIASNRRRDSNSPIDYLAVDSSPFKTLFAFVDTNQIVCTPLQLRKKAEMYLIDGRTHAVRAVPQPLQWSWGSRLEDGRIMTFTQMRGGFVTGAFDPQTGRWTRLIDPDKLAPGHPYRKLHIPMAKSGERWISSGGIVTGAGPFIPFDFELPTRSGGPAFQGFRGRTTSLLDQGRKALVGGSSRLILVDLKPVVERPKKPAVRVAPGAQGWVDVLALANPKQDGVAGKWRRTDDGLTVGTGGNMRLMLPVRPRGSYEVSFSFTRGKPQGLAAGLLLPVGSTSMLLGIGGSGGKDSGLSLIKGKGFKENETAVRAMDFVPGKKHHGLVRVEKEGSDVTVTVRANGKRLFQWEGSVSALRPPNFLPIPDKKRLGIGANLTGSTFHTFKLRMLEGDAEWLRKAQVKN